MSRGELSSKCYRIIACGIIALVLTVTSCGQDSPPPDTREEAHVLDNPVVVGTVTDEPGFSYQDPSTGIRSGFDIDMVQFLSSAPLRPRFFVTYNDGLIATRQGMLREGRDRGGASIVAASYTITAERELSIDFTEPYLQTQQGIMVREDYSEVIQNPSQLVGKTVCAQRDSTSYAELSKIPGVILRQEDGLGQCVTALQERNVDAVSTDEVLLYGYANFVNSDSRVPADRRLRVEGNANFGPIAQYAIGLPPQDGTANCELVSARIRDFIVNGAWKSALTSNLGAGANVNEYMPRPRPCVKDRDRP